LRANAARLDQAFRKSSLRQDCEDWPDLKRIADGGDDEGLKFWLLSRGRFLLSVLCNTSTYNEDFLFFVWDETAHAVGAAPPLVVFPAVESAPHPIIGAREVDPKEGLIWAFEKMLGDGSGGRYRRIRFEGEVPVLLEQVTKTEADHRDMYDFSREMTPQGIDWKHDVQKKYGCLASLQNPECLIQLQ
jgi:hypothetical protein